MPPPSTRREHLLRLGINLSRIYSMITSQGGKTSGQEKQQVGILEAGPRD